MAYEEDNSVFQLPSEEKLEPVIVFEASDKLSDKALFDELNAVSEGVIECRKRILDNIS
jgi:hypothetical protein